MPRQENVLTVFVASPSDVGDERTKLEEVINELNLSWARNLGIRLDLVRWETHAYPGIGEDAQDVINEQIPDDYDLFIGIMWCRYGTATGRSGSGTVEEFERAKGRNEADPSSVKLMVYFKDEAVTPSSLDLDQLIKVNEFRNSLGDEGVLYWKFGNLENFEKLARVHLTRQLQEWKGKLQKSEGALIHSETVDSLSSNTEIELEDDIGILDLFEIFEDRFEELGQISERIGSATEDLGNELTDHTKEIDKLSKSSPGGVGHRPAKRIISRVAADMGHYSARVEAELPLFSDSFNKGMDAIIRSLSMSSELDSDGPTTEQLAEMLDDLVGLRITLTNAEEKIDEFRQTVADFPRLTSDLNKAKRGVVSVLDKLIVEINNGKSLLRETETMVREIAGNIVD